MSYIIYICRHDWAAQLTQEQVVTLSKLLFEESLSKIKRQLSPIKTKTNLKLIYEVYDLLWPVSSRLNGHILMNATYEPAEGTILAEWKCAPKHPHSKACKCTRIQQVDMTVGECVIPCNECAFVQKELRSCRSTSTSVSAGSVRLHLQGARYGSEWQIFQKKLKRKDMIKKDSIGAFQLFSEVRFFDRHFFYCNVTLCRNFSLKTRTSVTNREFLKTKWRPPELAVSKNILTFLVFLIILFWSTWCSHIHFLHWSWASVV